MEAMGVMRLDRWIVRWLYEEVLEEGIEVGDWIWNTERLFLDDDETEFVEMVKRHQI
jgi:hypothetical protein